MDAKLYLIAMVKYVSDMMVRSEEISTKVQKLKMESDAASLSGDLLRLTLIAKEMQTLVDEQHEIAENINYLYSLIS